MSTYTRPAVTRSYDDIYDDISAAIQALATDPTMDRPSFWDAQAKACTRLRDLWNEIVFQACDDRAVPRWARSAAMTTRDRYAQEAREARAMAANA